MTVFQQYYTSYVNKESGSAGFQVKAMSPGISAEQQSLITRMIAYRIPPTADENQIETHPIALRYAYQGEHESIFLCSQSNGRDENSRPGNFFAHTLVMDPSTFTSIPPIFYWRSPFWVKRDTQSRPHSMLEPLPDFNIDPQLDFDKIWEFLGQGNRIKQFHKLMCAAIHAQTTHRRIVIIDNADNVALWIAAISCMLPPAYRPMLSFATYHHDPYQSQFMITGTTSDSSFHASPEEYLSYFILNVTTGQMSEVADSSYAARVTRDAAKIIKAGSADLYDELLLPFFTDYIGHFPKPTQIDEQLDLLATYTDMLTSHYREELQPDQIKAIGIAIDAFEQQRTFTDEDVEELAVLEDILFSAHKIKRDPILRQEHNRVGKLLQDNNVSTDKLIAKVLKNITEQIVYDGEILQARTRVAEQCQTYGEEIFSKAVNHHTYLPWLVQLLDKSNASAQQQSDLWQCVGPFITPNTSSQLLLQRSLRMVGMLLANKQFDEEQNLLTAMHGAMARREKEWLKQAVDIYQVSSPDEALKHFYYFLVQPFPINQRIPYRALLNTAQNELLGYEMKCDIDSDVRSGGPEHGIKAIERWVEHAKQNRYQASSLVTFGIKRLKRHCAPLEWHQLAPKILKNGKLAPLADDIETMLIQEMASHLTISTFSESDLGLYQKYQDHPALSEEQQTIMTSIVAMYDGKLNATLSSQLNQYLGSTPPEVYTEEVKAFLANFFMAPNALQSHQFLASALYVGKHNRIFWQCYNQSIARLFLNPATTKQSVAIFSFWFAEQPGTPAEIRIIQEFLLKLSSLFESVRKERGFAVAAQKFMAIAEPYDWYPLIQGFLSERKNVLASVGKTVGQGVVSQFQKFLPQQNTEKQKQAQEQQQAFEEYIAALFVRKKLRTAHTRDIPELYSLHQRELFWRLYWKEFMSIFLSKETDLSLEILTFWFNEAFTVFRRTPHIAQDFFIELPQAIESVQKERGFRDAVSKLDTSFNKHYDAYKKMPEGYKWYPLLQALWYREQKTR